MSPKQIQRIVIMLMLAGIVLWAGFEFLYKGSLNIAATGQVSLNITNASGEQVYSGTDTFYRLLPGVYIVSALTDQGGITKHIDVSPLSSTKLTVSSNQLLSSSLVAKTSLYNPIASQNAVIGYDPDDNRVKRIDPAGNKSSILTRQVSASSGNEAEPELPGEAETYNLYPQDQAIVSSSNRLFLVSANAVTKIATDGITFDTNDTGKYHLLVATQPQSESFIVAYKKDIFLYDNAQAKPKKIYTAKKDFDSLAYGKNIVGIYDTSIPPATQNITNTFSDRQVDLLLVDTAHNNQEQTLTGPITGITFSPDGQYATIAARNSVPYLFSITKKQKISELLAPLVAGPLWTSNTTYLYSVGSHIWQYNVDSQQGDLLAVLTEGVTSLAKNAAGDIIATTYANSGNAAIYRVGVATAATTASRTLANFLPYRTPDFNITYTSINGAPTITISTQAPLNSDSQLPLYRQNTLIFRQQALDYLKSTGIDLTGIAITYDPADPL